MGIVQAHARKKESSCVPCPHGYAPGNPGTFFDVHKKFIDLQVNCFEGVRLKIKKNLNRHFSACHTIHVSSTNPSGYKFGTCYKGCISVGPHERYPEISGDLMPNGNLAATFIHTLGCRLRLKHIAQLSNGKYEKSSSTAEYRRDDLTVSVTLDDPDFLKTSGTLVFHYLQAFTPRLTMGIEVTTRRNLDVLGGQESLVSGALRYSTGIWTISSTFGENIFHVSYHHKTSQQLQIGVDLETTLRDLESTGTIVYQFDIPHADMVFKGFVNTKTVIGGVFEKKLHPVPGASLLLSCQLNHKMQKQQVGIGLNFG